MKCQKCGKVIVEAKQDLTAKGECNNCGQQVMTPEQLKEVLEGPGTKTNKVSKLKDGGIKGGLSLITCADIRPPKNKKEAKDLNKKLVQIKEDIDASYFAMGTILQIFYDEETFKLLGHLTFREYVDNTLGFGWRKAMYLIGIAEAFGDKGLSLSDKQKAGIEWSKMRELAALFKKGILNQENLNEWLEFAKALGTRELADKIKEAKGMAIKDDGMVSFSIKLFPDQVEIINKALEEAEKLTDSEAKCWQLEMICAEFLGGLQEPVARLNKLIESIERVYKVKIDYEPVKGTEPAKKETKPAPGKGEGEKKDKPGKGKNNPVKGKDSPGKNSKKKSGKGKDKGEDLPYE